MLRLALRSVVSRKVHTSFTTNFKLTRLFFDKKNDSDDNYANQDVFSQLFEDDKPEIQTKKEENTFDFTDSDLKELFDESDFDELNPDILKKYDSGGAETSNNSWVNLTYTESSDPFRQFDADSKDYGKKKLTKDGYLLTIFTSIAEQSGQLSHRQRLQLLRLNLPEIPIETLLADLIPKNKPKQRERGKPNNSAKKRKAKFKKRAAQSTEYERLRESRRFRMSKKKALTPAEFIQTFEDYIKKDYPQFSEPKPVCKTTEHIPELEHGIWSPEPSALNLETSLKSGVEHSTRKDFRNSKHYTIFSIDPASAADIDDAIHIRVLQQPSSSNNFTKKIEIGVHIADTTHFINPETEPRMYDYARKNGTTRYWPHKVEHLMPRNLSSNACSLLPDVDRLTMSVVLEFSGKVVDDSVDGEVDWIVDDSVAAQPAKLVYLGPSVIKSCGKLAYSKVSDALVDESAVSKLLGDDESIKNLNTAEKIITSVREIHDFTKQIRQQRLKFGYRDMNNNNDYGVYFDMNTESMYHDLQKPSDKISMQLIEELMIIANYRVVVLKF